MCKMVPMNKCKDPPKIFKKFPTEICRELETHFLEAEEEQQGMSITSHFILSSMFPSDRDFLCRVSGLHPLGAEGA